MERRDGGVYPFRDGFLGGLRRVGLNVDVPPVPSSLPIMGHRWSASTSFVLAALRALHVDSSSAVTKFGNDRERHLHAPALQAGDTHGWPL